MRILWLKTELLHPVDKGGKIRTYQMLRELKRTSRITYLTLDDGAGGDGAAELAHEYCHELVRIPHRTSAKFSARFYADLALSLGSRTPYALKKYQSTEMRKVIGERLAAGEFDVLVCDFLTPSVNLSASFFSSSSCATVLFQHNVEAMIWKRHYEVQTHPIKKAVLSDQWRKMRAFERDACRRFDYVVAVSAEDAETMRREYGVENVADIPTGVDTDYFRPSPGAPSPEPNHLVFTGSMDWLPNEDALRYFTEQILPLVKKSVPEVRLTIVGRSPSPSLLELSRRDPSVVVTGRVEDVRPYIERAAAYVVPIRIGGGTRLKIYEAMAMEKPVISTTVGAEGLPVRHEAEILLADDPEAFSAAVVRVLREADDARALGQRAAERVREQFGWGKVTESFLELLGRASQIQATRAKSQTAGDEEKMQPAL